MELGFKKIYLLGIGNFQDDHKELSHHQKQYPQPSADNTAFPF